MSTPGLKRNALFIRKWVAGVALLVLLAGSAIVARSTLSAPPGSTIIWRPFLAFSLPAVVLTGLLLANLRVSGAPFRWLLVAVTLALLLLSLFAPPAILSTALSLPMLAVLYWLDDRRTSARPL